MFNGSFQACKLVVNSGCSQAFTPGTIGNEACRGVGTVVCAANTGASIAGSAATSAIRIIMTPQALGHMPYPGEAGFQSGSNLAHVGSSHIAFTGQSMSHVVRF